MPLQITDTTLRRITPVILKVVAPGVPTAELARWVSPIQQSCQRYGIMGVNHVCGFIAQTGHESAGFQHMSEDLSYSALRLTQVWPKRFPTTAAAAPYARNPEKLANYVYANRLGNGPAVTGDGWKYRGQGPLGLTGYDNWSLFAKSMNMTLDAALAYAATDEGGMMSAAWFWMVHGINALVDTPGVADETKAINGGELGLQERKDFYRALQKAMS